MLNSFFVSSALFLWSISILPDLNILMPSAFNPIVGEVFHFVFIDLVCNFCEWHFSMFVKNLKNVIFIIAWTTFVWEFVILNSFITITRSRYVSATFFVSSYAFSLRPLRFDTLRVVSASFRGCPFPRNFAILGRKRFIAAFLASIAEHICTKCLLRQRERNRHACFY